VELAVNLAQAGYGSYFQIISSPLVDVLALVGFLNQPKKNVNAPSIGVSGGGGLIG
jgi:hypothetical protein